MGLHVHPGSVSPLQVHRHSLGQRALSVAVPFKLQAPKLGALRETKGKLTSGRVAWPKKASVCLPRKRSSQNGTQVSSLGTRASIFRVPKLEVQREFQNGNFPGAKMGIWTLDMVVAGKDLSGCDLNLHRHRGPVPDHHALAEDVAVDAGL